MADTVTLNSGSGGAVLSTDEVTKDTVVQHVQYVKLMNGTADAVDVIPGDATNGLLVNLGTNNDVTVTGTVTVDGSGVTQPVSAASLPLPTGAATAANQSTIASSLSTLVTQTANLQNCIVQDDAPFTPATSYLMMIGGEYDDAAPDSVNEGDAGNVRISANRSMYVQIRDAAGNERGLNVDANGAITVAQATAANLNATVTGTVTANLAAGTNNIGDVDILSIAAGDNNIGNVDIVTMPNVTLAAGTNTNEVVGDAAHDAAIAGNPVRIAGRALTADYTSVATGDTADLITTVGGKLITHPYSLPENLIKGASGDITTVTAQSLIAAGGANIKNYITHLLVQNSHATVGTWVNIQDGVGGSTIYTVYAAAAGGGASVTLPCPIATSANTALGFACATTGANVRVSASGYKGP